MARQQTQAIAIQRARSNIPKFNDNLRYNADAMTPLPEIAQGCPDFLVLSIIAIDAAKEDVRICQNVHLADFFVYRVNVLAADGFIGEAWHCWKRIEQRFQC